MPEQAVSHNDLARFEQVLDQKFENVYNKLDQIINDRADQSLKIEKMETRLNRAEQEISQRPTIYQLLTACGVTAVLVIAIIELLIN